jgi:hypothetical protein
MSDLVTVAMNLCAACLSAKGSRMCETEGCACWHEVLPATLVSRVVPLVLPNLDLLHELEEFLGDRADIRDGYYGEPVPDKSMQLLNAVRWEIARLTGPPKPGSLQVERQRLADHYEAKGWR